MKRISTYFGLGLVFWTLSLAVIHADCVAPPSGIVGWWKGDGDATDVMAADNGSLENVGFTNGMVGKAFMFDGSSSMVRIPASSNLDLGHSAGLTIEMWINPADLNFQDLFEWNQNNGVPFGAGPIGTHLEINETPGDGSIWGNIVDTAGTSHTINSATGLIIPNNFQHVALTYDKTSGMAVLYRNGVVVATNNIGSVTPQTGFDIFLGGRPAGFFTGIYFHGAMDEPAIYNRALSASEIAAIYNAGSAGKCAPLSPAVPAIVNFSPLAATNGAVVVITGTNFRANVTSNLVYFGAVRATVLTASANSLTVLVPVGAIYGPISVIVNGLVANSSQSFEPTFRGSGIFSSDSFAPGFNLQAGDTPGGTAVSDLDGDGKPDLVVINVHGNTIGIYRNIGTNNVLASASFAEPIWLPLPGNPISVVLADVDGDGRPDIVVADNQNNNISIFQNLYTSGGLTTNSFSPRMDFPVGQQPRGLAPADLNGDGHIDIVTANYGDNTISILQNNGFSGGIATNSFAAHVDLATGAGPGSVAIGDLDGDGKPDIAIADSGDNRLSVFHNASTGGILTTQSFDTRMDLTTSGDSEEVVIADVDGDGRPELLVSGYLSQVISVFPNLSVVGSLTTNSFGPRFDFATGGRSHRVALGDVDGDGKPDVTVTTELPNQFLIFRNLSSAGMFSSNSLAVPVALAAGWNPNAISIADFDGDGRPDIVFCNTYDGNLSVFQNQTGFSTPPPVVTHPPIITSVWPNSGTNGTAVVISGTNFSAAAVSNLVYFGAVRATVLTASTNMLTVRVPVGATYAPPTVTVNGLAASAKTPFLPTFLGAGAGFSADNFGPRLNLPATYGTGQTVIADLDGDGKPDLLVASGASHILSIFRNISTNGILSVDSFAPRVDLTGTTGDSSPYFVAVADVDGDGKLDIIVTELGDNAVSVFHNDCTPGNLTAQSFATRVDFATGGRPQGLAVCDVDGDGKPDILTANTADGTVSILRNTSTLGSLTASSFAPKVDFATGAGCDRVAVGDLNGDGKPDVVAANSNAGTVSVLQNINADASSLDAQSFAPAIQLASVADPLDVKIVDVDGDGKPDIAVTSYLPQTFSVFQNINSGGTLTAESFATRIDYGLDGRGHTISIGDLDGDGKADLVVDCELNSLLALFRNVSSPGALAGGSLVTPPVELGTGWNAWGSSIGDLDGDGRPDIVFANTYDGNISIYQNLAPLAGPPVITQQPVSQTVNEGGSVQFSVTATGVSPFSYQWKFNGAAIGGATNATLILTNLHPNQSGNYQVTVANSYGPTSSSNAALTVSAQSILIYDYAGTENITMSGREYSYAYKGRMYFIPSQTNGVFMGWAVINGKKQYWVSPFSDYLVATISGSRGHVYTVLGEAGEGTDDAGHPKIWSNIHKGLNTQLNVANGKQVSFPATFTFNGVQTYPDALSGGMALYEETSTFIFSQANTQSANNGGKTVYDLVSAQTKLLEQQGYQKQ